MVQPAEMPHQQHQQLSAIRFVGRIPGRYTLPDRYSETEVSVFACRTYGITPFLVTLSAPVVGKVGDKVSTVFDDLGLIKGHISGTFDDGFRMDVDTVATDVERLAMRLEWLKRKSTSTVVDNRKHKRVLPRNPGSTLYLADGSRVRCFIIDMSASGVAVSASVRPGVGTPLAVGRVVGRVVRHLPAGFAVQFIRTIDLDVLEKQLVVQEPEGVAI